MRVNYGQMSQQVKVLRKGKFGFSRPMWKLIGA